MPVRCPICHGDEPRGPTGELLAWAKAVGRQEALRPPVPSPSRVRLDPLRHVFQLRAYAQPVDVKAPLDAMREPYNVTGIVSVVGDSASVDMVIARSEITREALADLDAALREPWA